VAAHRSRVSGLIASEQLFIEQPMSAAIWHATGRHIGATRGVALTSRSKALAEFACVSISMCGREGESHTRVPGAHTGESMSVLVLARVGSDG
jgi:hypothetical protein